MFDACAVGEDDEGVDDSVSIFRFFERMFTRVKSFFGGGLGAEERVFADKDDEDDEEE